MILVAALANDCPTCARGNVRPHKMTTNAPDYLVTRAWTSPYPESVIAGPRAFLAGSTMAFAPSAEYWGAVWGTAARPWQYHVLFITFAMWLDAVSGPVSQEQKVLLMDWILPPHWVVATSRSHSFHAVRSALPYPFHGLPPTPHPPAIPKLSRLARELVPFFFMCLPECGV